MKYEGLFLNPLVTRTLSFFLQCTQSAVIKYDYPCGSLLLAILAVQYLPDLMERALRLCIRFQGQPIPKSGVKYEFKESNFVIHLDYYKEGIAGLIGTQWEEIIAAATNQHSDVAQSPVNTAILAPNGVVPIKKKMRLFEAPVRRR
ncbi:hypothetical protein K474DRAFT_1713037 [Panus rudis PR-1116 ss-1]|nr:hypothetical protein K474DRAFT_1713037 [Panus rudis PR-1116 ss-1]